jgi:hypothetical protein
MAEEQRKYLRSRADGSLFAYHADLAARPDLETIDEDEAYPERHMPEHVAKKKKAADDDDDKEDDIASGITPETGVEKPKPTDPALGKQAAKNWPK